MKPSVQHLIWWKFLNFLYKASCNNQAFPIEKYPLLKFHNHVIWIAQNKSFHHKNAVRLFYFNLEKYFVCKTRRLLLKIKFSQYEKYFAIFSDIFFYAVGRNMSNWIQNITLRWSHNFNLFCSMLQCWNASIIRFLLAAHTNDDNEFGLLKNFENSAKWNFSLLQLCNSLKAMWIDNFTSFILINIVEFQMFW